MKDSCYLLIYDEMTSGLSFAIFDLFLASFSLMIYIRTISNFPEYKQYHDFSRAMDDCLDGWAGVRHHKVRLFEE